jgi:hypothetical protein
MLTAVLETQYESFNERDTSVLANGAEAGRDPLAITPGLEPIAPELLARFRGRTESMPMWDYS